MWKTLSKKKIHRNKWFKVNQYKFKMPNKKSGVYYVVETNGASLIIPIRNKKIIFEKQYRYIFNKWFIELPCGGVKMGSNFYRTAKSELLEETGYRAKKINKIGSFAPFNGAVNEICNVYLATGLEFVGKKLDDTEYLKTFEIPVRKAYKLVDEGKINEGMTLAALAIARKVLLK